MSAEPSSSTQGDAPDAAPSAELAAALDQVIAKLPGGGEPRPGQREMAARVESAAASGSHLVCQAGTGTGKSIAYLVPAILSGKRTVVATATKALQDQLATKDLPFLKKHLDTPFSWAMVKGRANYLCLQRLSEVQDATMASLELEGIGGPTREVITRLADWADTTETGDRADLPFEPGPVAWSAVSVGGDECPGAGNCPAGEHCFAEAARKRASGADVIVANLALYGVNMRAEGKVLPDHDLVIIDEAHQLEDVISNTVGMQLSAGRFGALAGRVRAIVTDDELSSGVAAAGTTLAAAIGPLRGDRLSTPFPPQVQDALANASLRLARVLEALGNIKTDVVDADQRRVRALQSASSLADELGVALDLPDGYVAWVDGTGSDPRLSVAPLDVAPFLSANAWAARASVLTSATLPDVVATTVGLPIAQTVRADVGSPFDYDTNGLLYCATHLPDPRHPDHAAAQHAELRALITAAGGRTLALFTSWRALDAAVEALADDLPYTVLHQRDLPVPKLIAAFSDEEESCLFATTGLFQGIDVPGATLSLVTIDRIPFPRPDEPLLQARRDKAGPSAFRTIDLPKAQILLAQAAGRLIRNQTDRGVVAVLDPRLNSKNYRWDLVRAMPPMRRTRDRAEVEAFLAELAARPT